MKKGRAGTMTHDYKRHGTTTLFAALNVLDGTVIGRNMARTAAGVHPLPQHHRRRDAGRADLHAISTTTPPKAPKASVNISKGLALRRVLASPCGAARIAGRRGRDAHADDDGRGLREGPAAAWDRPCLRDHRVGDDADLGPLPGGGDHLLGLRPRGERRDDGRRLYPGDRQDGDGDRAERAGDHQLRHRGQDRLLEPLAPAPRHAAGGEPDHRPGRVPGGGADGALPRHGLLPGGGARPGPDRGGAEPGDREGAPRARRRRRSTCRGISGPRWSTSSCRRSCGWSGRRAARRRWRRRRGC